MSLPDHACNAYCGRSEHEHCELVYADGDAGRDDLWQALAAEYGLWVTDAVPAAEPYQYQALKVRQLHGARPPRRPVAWLIWYRTDYAQARRDYEAGTIPRYRTTTAS